MRRSRKGAWIEIDGKTCIFPRFVVAPVRERGLKWIGRGPVNSYGCRSRKGAWIEMSMLMPMRLRAMCRSRKGAWIEILLALLDGCYAASLP